MTGWAKRNTVAAIVCLLAFFLLLPGCGGGGGATELRTNPVSIQDNRPAPQPAISTETLSQALQAGSGVTIQTNSGATVQIPANTVSEDTIVTVQVLAGPGLNPPNIGATPVGDVIKVTLRNGVFLQPFQVDLGANGLTADEAIGFTLVDGVFTAQPIENGVSPRSDDFRGAVLGPTLRVGVSLIAPSLNTLQIGLMRVSKNRNTAGFWRGIGAQNSVQATTLNVAWPAIDSNKRYALLLHGINDGAKGMTPLYNFLSELTFSGKKAYDGVVIYQYDYTAGARSAGDGLYPQLKTYLGSSGAQVDVFAHSFGGVVARYMAQVKEPDSGTRRINRIFMFGTPNNGCPANQLPEFFTSLAMNAPTSPVFWRWSPSDPTVDDLRPNGGVLQNLNGPSFDSAKSQVGYYIVNGDFVRRSNGLFASRYIAPVYATLGAIVANFGGVPNDGIVPVASAYLNIFDGMSFRGAKTFGWHHSDLIEKLTVSDPSTSSAVSNTLINWIRLAPPPPVPNPNPPNPNPPPPNPPPASPNAPRLTAPDTGATIPGEVHFQWQGQGGPNASGNFALRVRDPQGNQVLDRGWLPDTEFRWTPTAGAGQYTWSVSAGATNGAAEARSEVRTFTVPLISPNPPLLLSPEQGGVAGRAQEVRFRWQGQGGPNASGQFSLRVFAPNGTQVLDRPWAAETEFGWTPSAGPGTYIWNVHAGATNGAAESISETRSFVLPVFSPAAPSLVSPYPASVVPVNGGVHFRWLGNQDVNSTGAFALRVWNPQGVQVLDYGWHHDQDYDWVPTSGPGTYKWSVSAGAAPGVPETASEQRTFVVANDVPNLPALIFPDPYRVVGVRDSIRFQWQGQGGNNAVGNYKLSLWDPQGRLFEQDWTSSQEATWLPNLVSGTDTWPSGTYQWMVRAQATPGFQSVHSEVRTFTVQPGLVGGVHIAQRDTMRPNEVLLPNQTVVSLNGTYKFTLQRDGNIVLYKNGNQPLWASNTSNTPAFLLMDQNGNLVLYDTSGNARWNATLRGPATANSRLVVQNDGNVVIYRPNDSAIWATDTSGL